MAREAMPKPLSALMSNKRNDQRDLALKALVSRFEKRKEPGNSLFLSAEEFDELLVHYFNKHDFDRTLEAADLAISQHNFTPEFYKWKALIHKINLEEDEALAALEKLSIYAPNDEESLMLRLEVLIHFEKRAEARSILDQLQSVVEGDAKHSLLAFFDGLLLMQVNRYDDSWHAFVEAVRLDPHQEPALDELLNATEFEYLRSQLGKVLQRVLNKDPFNDLVWYYLGLWYDDKGNDHKAMEAFANARSLQENPRYNLEYADKLFDLDHYQRALKVYGAYFDSSESEESYETYMRVGRSYQMLGDIEKAKAAFFRAVELDPNMYDTYQHLGECFVMEEKWGVAAYNYGRAVEQLNHTADCWMGLALCQAAMNETEEAEIAFRQTLEMNDRFSEAIVAYAIFMVDCGRERDALNLMTDSLERYQDAGLLYGTVALHLMCNKRKLALEYLNDALGSYYEDHDLLLDWYPELNNDAEVQAIFALHRP